MTDDEIKAPCHDPFYLPFGWGAAVLAEYAKAAETMRYTATTLHQLSISLFFMALEAHR